MEQKWSKEAFPYAALILFISAATVSRASSQEILVNSPEPLGPVLFRG